MRSVIPIQMSVRNRSFYFLFKRLADLLLSLTVCMLLLSWLIPLMILLIPLDTGGTPFFIQYRRGRYGRLFPCIKFRTMVPNRQANWLPALENDPRITRMGRLLRNWNIDELPQFINVLRGEMSVVGPRPHMQSDCDRFSVVVNRYNSRHLLRPGITGMAQVRGYHGPALDEISIRMRYSWDIWYLRNCSVLLDLRILGKTLTQVFKTRKQYSTTLPASNTVQYPQKVNSLMQ
ncbi:MAG: sugar transferase [Pseudobacter sp.]|uniref:sugar transferase n=1 Tax=Pseudobacter sp. TaxID=2045420 RepID=UPI003F819FFE